MNIQPVCRRYIRFLFAWNIIFALTCLPYVAQADDASATNSTAPATGIRRHPFRCILKSPGGALPFTMTLVQPTGATSWTALIQNGDEIVQLQDAEFDDKRLHIPFPHYDAHITARRDQAGSYHGRWTKVTGPEEQSELPFVATPDVMYRFTPTTKPASAAKLAYSWRVQFSKSDEPAVGLFSQDDDGRVIGTFVTTTGDYRYLEGDFDGKRLRLSSFDGAHAFLFDAELTPDGALKGGFWSRDKRHETWRATPSEKGLAADPWTLTKATKNVDLSAIKFADLDGKLRSLGDDPAWQGKPRIIEISGSWCPNCHDAAEHLEKLYQAHKANGLVVIGLMFEVTGNDKRDARQVRRFRDRHQLTYPLLLAGKADRKRVASQVKLIDKLRSYPTMIFVDRTGKVRDIYTGYAGPATGEFHRNQSVEIENRVQRLIGLK